MTYINNANLGIDQREYQPKMSITDGFNRVRHSSAFSFTDNSINTPIKDEYRPREWNLKFLKQQFVDKDLEELYKRYEQRSQIGTFSVYLGLQIFLSLTFMAISAISCANNELCNTIGIPNHLPSIVSQSVLLAICILLIFLVNDEKIFKKYPWLLFTFALIIVISIEIIDIILVLNHKRNGDNQDPEPLMKSTILTMDVTTKSSMPTSYSTTIDTTTLDNIEEEKPNRYLSKMPVLSLYNHLIIYLFLPISQKNVACAIGFTVSIICVILFTVIESTTEKIINVDDFVKQVIADIVFYLSLNFVGYYTRYVGEINMRIGFLDKRNCIETTFKLKFEKEQEESLLLSIIPKHIANQVKEQLRNHLIHFKYQHRPSNQDSRPPFNNLYIQKHENVSILFADICNFTPLTSKLKEDKLVETLNDLFGKFDDAAERHGCMRIKILGDCYYCVSGVENEDVNHAQNCVEMGLEMIELIKSVNDEKRGINVNMRIGIHTGYILSGIIGLKKWQYDIWSKHVTIANHMESTGKAGAVHITTQTKELLGDSYEYEEVSEIPDSVLRENRIRTFLIYPINKKTKSKSYRRRNQASSNNYHNNGQRRMSIIGNVSDRLLGNRKRRDSAIFSTASSIEDEYIPSITQNSHGRRSVLMDTSLRNFRKMKVSAGEYMREEIEKLPLRIYDLWIHPDEINPLVLRFKDKSWEKPYSHESDPLYKYYILASYILLISMISILIITEKHPHVPLWFEYAILFTILSLLILSLWVSHIWDNIVDPHFELDDFDDAEYRPNSKLVYFFYKQTKKINTNLTIRTTIFILVALFVVAGAILDVLTGLCIYESPRNYTYRCVLAIMVIFVFLRINHILKFTAALLCLIFYGLMISGELVINENVKNIFNQEYFGFNEVLHKDNIKYSHIIYLFICSTLFVVMDRQHEYMRRLDFQWKHQLNEEKDQVSDTKLVNKMLLQNILPHHVANIYLGETREPGQLYSEKHEHVAVMFASIPKYLDFYSETDIHQGDSKCLTVLNEIITTFDKLLVNRYPQVEKIKVIGATYMAACGLFTDRRESNEDYDVALENALTLTRFAGDMIDSLKNLSLDKFECTRGRSNFQLRIGLNLGGVIAGVVGAQKPLYDIWGDAVNVASRMDSTGETGKIQVTKPFKELLDKARVSCTFRGVKEVKGKGKMELFFVDLDERGNLIPKDLSHESNIKFESSSAQTTDDDDDYGLQMKIDESEDCQNFEDYKQKAKLLRIKRNSRFNSLTISTSERDFTITPVIEEPNDYQQSTDDDDNDQVVDAVNDDIIITLDKLDIHEGYSSDTKEAIGEFVSINEDFLKKKDSEEISYEESILSDKDQRVSVADTEENEETEDIDEEEESDNSIEIQMDFDHLGNIVGETILRKISKTNSISNLSSDDDYFSIHDDNESTAEKKESNSLINYSRQGSVEANESCDTYSIAESNNPINGSSHTLNEGQRIAVIRKVSEQSSVPKCRKISRISNLSLDTTVYTPLKNPKDRMNSVPPSRKSSIKSMSSSVFHIFTDDLNFSQSEEDDNVEIEEYEILKSRSKMRSIDEKNGTSQSSLNNDVVSSVILNFSNKSKDRKKSFKTPFSRKKSASESVDLILERKSKLLKPPLVRNHSAATNSTPYLTPIISRRASSVGVLPQNDEEEKEIVISQPPITLMTRNNSSISNIAVPSFQIDSVSSEDNDEEDESSTTLNDNNYDHDTLTPDIVYTKKDSGYGSQGQLKVSKNFDESGINVEDTNKDIVDYKIIQKVPDNLEDFYEHLPLDDE